MDSKEILYEIALKYNTLKMYENTLEQMKKNGVGNEESLSKIEGVKNVAERELVELLNPNLSSEDTGIKNPSIEETKHCNAFVKALNDESKRGVYKELYDIRKNFFDNITKPVKDDSPVKYRDESKDVLKEAEYKKPTFADVQDKISNSQWISYSNFIVEFPKKEIDIDEWRVSNFFYRNKQTVSCSSRKVNTCGGELDISINDFAEKREDGTYNILAKTVHKLETTSRAHVYGNIHVNIINNGGDLLYTMVFENCRFVGSDADGFTYDSVGLRKVILRFAYDELHILAPNEKLAPKEFR
jgi:hypothetical protein